MTKHQYPHNLDSLTYDECRSLLAEGAIRILTDKSTEFNMRSWLASSTEDFANTVTSVAVIDANCGCVLGFTILQNSTPFLGESFAAGTTTLTGGSRGPKFWLFNGYWPSNRRQAALRVLYYLEHERIPLDWYPAPADQPGCGCWAFKIINNQPDSTLIQRLTKFILP